MNLNENRERTLNEKINNIRKELNLPVRNERCFIEEKINRKDDEMTYLPFHNRFSRPATTSSLRAAKKIEYNEEAIGNTVYQRSSLGNVNNGDGFKFLGRGWFQITGRSCYKEIGNKIGKDLVANPTLVEKSPLRSETACVYWKLPKFGNKVKDSSDANVKLITYYVNGGYNGLAERQRLFRELWKELQENPNAYT